METPLIPGSIVSKRINEARDVHEWEFDNGVKIWLKDTDFDENVLFWRGISSGGYSLIEDEDLHSAQCLNGLMTLANVANHTADDINRLMNAVPGRLNMRWNTSRKYCVRQNFKRGHVTGIGFVVAAQSGFNVHRTDGRKSPQVIVYPLVQ